MTTCRDSNRWRLGFLTLVLALVPACSSSAGGMRGNGPGLGQRIVDRLTFRPVYPQANPVPRTRPLYLSGYAGARYGPAATAEPVNPTSYQFVPSPWLAWWRGTR